MLCPTAVGVSAIDVALTEFLVHLLSEVSERLYDAATRATDSTVGHGDASVAVAAASPELVASAALVRVVLTRELKTNVEVVAVGECLVDVVHFLYLLEAQCLSICLVSGLRCPLHCWYAPHPKTHPKKGIRRAFYP